MEQEYQVTITNSSFDMSKRDVVKFKDLSTAESINECMKRSNGEPLSLQQIKGWYVLHVVNPKSTRNKEYDVFCILANGIRYQTGSQYVKDSFLSIASDLEDEIYADDITIKIVKMLSKNNIDNAFYKCVLD